MTTIRIGLSTLAAAAVCLASVALPLAQDGNIVTVPFSDPARPGSVTVSLLSGGVVIKGGDRRDVLVSASGRTDRSPRTRADVPSGLRRLTQAPGLTITEENNEIHISASRTNREADIEIQVPARVNLSLRAHNNGDILVENADGDIEATNHNRDIRLTNVSGSVVANTHNGDVRVTLTRVAGEKPMSFTSFNGDVDVTLPASAKANLKLRSDRGEIFTDFDIQMRPASAAQTSQRAGRVRIDINQSIYGAINGGGPEFELRTYNGDIFVRRGPQ